VSHASDYRFQASPGRGIDRKYTLKDHAGLPDFDVTCKIGWGGFFSDEKERKAIEPDIIEYLENQGVTSDISEDDVEEEEVKEVPA
jgi:hypothetical protein